MTIEVKNKLASEFDMPGADRFLRPSHDRRLLRRFEVEVFGAQCQDDAYISQVSDSHDVSGAIAHARLLPFGC